MEKLSGYSFGPERRPKHDWPKIFDGSIWRLRKGEDFTMSAKAFRRQVYSRAHEQGFSIHAVIEDENTLVLQATQVKKGGKNAQ